MNKLDFKGVADAALNSVDNLLSEWLPGGKYKGHEFFALNPTRADKSLGSFAVNTHSGAWADYATGDAGGDLVSLYAYLFCGGKQGDALRQVAERLRIGGFEPVARTEWDGSPKTGGKSKRNSWTPIAPFAEHLLQNLNGAKVYRYCKKDSVDSLRAVYRDVAGRPLCVVQRFTDDTGRKSDLPFVWAKNSEGVEQWCNRRLQDPQPLFGLDALAAKPSARVLIVEGEKCKMAAESYFDLKDWAVISWLGGCNGWGKADWSAVSGRDVLLWPDCDSQREKLGKAEEAAGVKPEDKPYLPRSEQPGMKAMLGIAEKLLKQDCTVRIANIPDAGYWPSGYDIADVIQDTEPLVSVREMLDTAVPYPFTESSLESSVPMACDFSHAAESGDSGAEMPVEDDDGNPTKRLAALLEGYAQIGLKQKVLNLNTCETFTVKQLEKLFGKTAVATWFKLDARKQLGDVEADIYLKRKKLEISATVDDEFKDALNRYIYLDGTTDAFDRNLKRIVSLAAVNAAIPDRYQDWGKSPLRLVCPMSNYHFDPAIEQGVVMMDDGSGVKHINMFNGLPVKVGEVDKSLKGKSIGYLIEAFPECRNIIGLIYHLCSGNGDDGTNARAAEWVLNWLACRVRQPAEKPATALVFISETQGVGKSTFGEKIVKALFGEYTRQLDQNALESRFNSALLFALVTIFEEISPSDERLNVIGKLKNMITSDVIMVERKGRDAEKHGDFNSFIIFSNDERSIPIESNDRRFMVVNCNKKFSDAQYEALQEELDNGGIRHFAEFLHALPLTYQEDGEERKFSPHTKPLMTPIKKRMISLNKPSWEAFLDDWREGDLDVPYVTCAAADLWTVYKRWAHNTKTFHLQQKNFYANIGKRLEDKRSNVALREGWKKVRFFIVPHEQLSEAARKKYTPPTTDETQRGSQGSVNKADYYGKQISDFRIAAELAEF